MKTLDSLRWWQCASTVFALMAVSTNAQTNIASFHEHKEGLAAVKFFQYPGLKVSAWHDVLSSRLVRASHTINGGWVAFRKIDDSYWEDYRIGIEGYVTNTTDVYFSEVMILFNLWENNVLKDNIGTRTKNLEPHAVWKYRILFDDLPAAQARMIRLEAVPSGVVQDQPTSPANKSSFKNGVPISIYNQIAANAAAEWPNDYKMQVFEIDRQTEAYKKLHQ